MAFNPLEQTGIPVEESFRSWRELNVEPMNQESAHPFSQCRTIVLNGAEVEAVFFGHQFARHTDNPEIKRALALTRRADAQQQKAVNWLLPAGQSTLETTIFYEQVAVELTAWLAQNEPDPYLKQTLDFGLLEDFDHLYRYANLYELSKGKKAEELTQHLTEIMPGRPTYAEHRHPYDDVRCHYDTHSADPVSKLHAMTITAAEQQTMNFYMNTGPSYVEPIARGLYLEIAMIEEQHVTHYESLLDPTETWLQQWVMHEYNECYLYHSFMTDETDERLRKIWELHLNMEIGQLQVAAKMLRRFEGRDAAEILPAEMPAPTKFQSNTDYVRRVLAEQLELQADGTYYVPERDLPKGHRYYQHRDRLNHDGVPTEQIIDMNREQQGREYRDEPEGEHPIVDLREPVGTRR